MPAYGLTVDQLMTDSNELALLQLQLTQQVSIAANAAASASQIAAQLQSKSWDLIEKVRKRKSYVDSCKARSSRARLDMAPPVRVIPVIVLANNNAEVVMIPEVVDAIIQLNEACRLSSQNDSSSKCSDAPEPQPQPQPEQLDPPIADNS